MRVTVVVEGPIGEVLLGRLVACHPSLRGGEIQIRETESRYTSLSKARTILTLRQEPVAVIANAGTSDPELIAEKRGLLEWMLGEAGPLSDWRAILLVPGVEMLLFRDERLLRSLLPVEPSPEQLLRARSSPGDVLAELFARAGEQPFPEALLERLSRADVSSLWATPELRPLEEFLLEKSVTQRPGTAP